MKVKVLVINPPWTDGGVKTVSEHLILGLKKEGHEVEIIDLKESSIMRALSRDIRGAMEIIKIKEAPRIIIYMGSIPLFGHVFYRVLPTSVFLFVHGYTRHQLIATMKSTKRWREVFGALFLLFNLDFSRIFRTVDYYLAHCETVFETCFIPRSRRVLLPQFMFREEITALYDFGKREKERNDVFDKKEFIITAYTTKAVSPRLLTTHDLIKVAKLCSARINKDVKFVIIDPRAEKVETKYVRILNYISRHEFLKMLANSILYLETTIDEEIRYSSLESLAIGTPVAKLVYEPYQNRCDYSAEDLLIARSLNELINKITNYLKHVSDMYHHYSIRGLEFVRTKRVWDRAKVELLKTIERIRDDG